MIAALVNVLAVPTSPEAALVVANPPSYNGWHELVADSWGSCVVNKKTNCWCSSNYAEKDCDDSTTGPTTDFYGAYEDCGLSFAQPVDISIPVFDTEAPVEKCVSFHKPPSGNGRACQIVCDAYKYLTPQGKKCNPVKLTEQGKKKAAALCTRQRSTDACKSCKMMADSVFIDGHGSNQPKDTRTLNGDLANIADHIRGKAMHLRFRSDHIGEDAGFKICAVNPWKNVGGQAPTGGAFPDGTVPPDNQACPCGTNPQGTLPQGKHPEGTGTGDNCYSNPKWPCERDKTEERAFFTDEDAAAYDTAHAGGGTEARDAKHCKFHINKNGLPNGIATIRATQRHNETLDLTQWERDVESSLARNKVTHSIACCVCQGGWMSGYDPQGDLSTEKELGQMTRSDCIFAAKAVAGANAASIDDTATETVKGTCYAEINAHYSAKGWTADSSKQACLFGK